MIGPFKVGLLTIRVEALDAVEADDQNLYGRYSQRQDLIHIQRSLSPAKQAVTLLFDAYGIKRERLSEEDVCTVLDAPLTALFADNPLLAGTLHQAVNHGRPFLE